MIVFFVTRHRRTQRTRTYMPPSCALSVFTGEGRAGGRDHLLFWRITKCDTSRWVTAQSIRPAFLYAGSRWHLLDKVSYFTAGTTANGTRGKNAELLLKGYKLVLQTKLDINSKQGSTQN